MAYTTPPDFTPFDILTAAQLDILSNNDISFNNGTGIAVDVITDAKLVYGKLRSRQGGSTTNWSTTGTTTYDYSATNTFIQTGSKTITTDNFVITFPTAFAQVPLVQLTPFLSGASNNTWSEVIAVTATTFTVRNLNASGIVTTESVFWLAIGE